MSIKPQSFSKRVNAYFERYSTTTQILQALLKQEAAPQDFIVLACARLDSLANHAIPGKLSQSEKFSRFLDEHSRHGEVLSSVSVGDLYSSFLVELWQLPGVIELPGRLRMFDEVKQRDFIDLYWKSELALAEDDLEGLMDFVFNAAPDALSGHPSSKPCKELFRLAREHSTRSGKCLGHCCRWPVQIGDDSIEADSQGAPVGSNPLPRLPKRLHSWSGC